MIAGASKKSHVYACLLHGRQGSGDVEGDKRADGCNAHQGKL